MWISLSTPGKKWAAISISLLCLALTSMVVLVSRWCLHNFVNLAPDVYLILLMFHSLVGKLLWLRLSLQTYKIQHADWLCYTSDHSRRYCTWFSISWFHSRPFSSAYIKKWVPPMILFRPRENGFGTHLSHSKFLLLAPIGVNQLGMLNFGCLKFLPIYLGKLLEKIDNGKK